MQSSSAVKMWSKVLIVAGQPIVRFGLARLLSQETDIEICGEADNAADALLKTETLRVDLAVITVPLQGKLCPGLFQQLKAKRPPLKILAGIRVDDPSFACRIIRSGADGCIHWGEPLAELVKAIRTVLRGDLYLGSLASKRLLHGTIGGNSPDGDAAEYLSDQELHVFAMIGQGLTTQQIATALDLSPRTIESHRKKIKLKLQVRHSVELNRRAYQWWQEHH